MAKSIDQKLGDLIRRLGSNHDGEVVATARALQRVLKSAGRDLHQLAGIIEKNGGGELSEAEMEALYSAGYEAGLKAGESRHVATFHNIDADGDWYEMAQFCWERADRLSRRHRSFVEGMVMLAGESELSTKQKVYLKSLYRQLGGE